MTFQEAGISPELTRAIEEIGFTKMMPVQEKVIPYLLKEDTDIIALAQTGTGKTAAYGLPIIQRTDLSNNVVQSLVLSPTRELCIQIADDLNQYSKYIDDLRVVPVYGGASIETQIKALKKGAHIVVATPGRLIDMIKRRVLKLDTVEKVVLDEADEMLNMGFEDSIEEILSEIPEEHNTLLFSATMPPEIARIARKYMNNPIEVTIGHKNTGAENIKHVCYTVHQKDKYLTLKRIADYYPNIYGIVFCRTRKDTQEVADNLISDGYNAEPLHGDLSQAQRDSVMSKFRSKKLNLLVATDVAARGLDVDDLTHIINYSLPEELDIYNHRSGRTGRAGKTGISIAITNLKEKFRIKMIEKRIGKQFVWEKVPNGKEVCEKQLFHLIDKIEHIEIEHSEIEPYLPLIYKKFSWLEKEDIIQRFVSVEFNRFLQYYKNAKDLNDEETQKSRKSDRRNDRDDFDSKKDFKKENWKKEADTDFTKIFINIGKTDGVFPNNLIDILNKYNRGVSFKVGKIDIMKNYSLIGIDNKNSDKIINKMNGMDYEGRKIIAKLDDIQTDNSDRPEKRRSNRNSSFDSDNKRSVKKDFFNTEDKRSGKKDFFNTEDNRRSKKDFSKTDDKRRSKKDFSKTDDKRKSKKSKR